MSRQPMPRTPSPRTLDTASLAAHRPANVSARPRTYLRSWSVRTRRAKRSPNLSSAAAIRSTLMMSIPSSVVPSGTTPAGRRGSSAAPARGIAYSTVTDLARFRGWSTSVPRATAVKYANSWSGITASTGDRASWVSGTNTTSSA